MPLEAASFISDLVATNPVGATDTKAQGDDHLRLLKSTIKATLPNADKAFYFPDAVAKTANYTILAADMNKFITGDATGGAFNLTLPTLAAANDGWYVICQKIDSSANAVTIVGTINGAANFALGSRYDAILVWWNGSAWYALPILAKDFRTTTAVGGTVDAITVTTVPGFVAYSTTMRFTFTSAGLNTVTNPTINVDGLGAKTIKKWGNVALRKGEIGEAGHICDCMYDGTSVILLNPVGRYETITIACSDETTALTAGTDKTKWRQKACSIQDVRASLSTGQTSGNIFTVDVHESGTTVLSTKVTIDNGEKTSTTAVTPPVISDAAVADDAEMSIDVDQIGDGTAKGLKVYLDVRYAS